MTGRTGAGGPGDYHDFGGRGEDAVAALFARERQAVRPEPADDLRWQAIVREARRQRRSRAAGYAAGLAAAVAVVAGGITLAANVAQPEPPPAEVARQATATGTPLPLPTTPSASALTPPGPTTTTPATPPGTVTVAPRTIPAGFRVTSVSNAGKDVLYAMGSGSCGSGTCPALVGSADDGASWRLVTTFPGFSAPGGDRGRLPTARTLSEVRFASPQIGFVFGGGIQVTRDGGRTWRDFGHPGDLVLDLETKGGRVYLTTASGCGERFCEGTYEVAAAPLSAAAAETLGRPQDLSTDEGPARFVDADIDLTGTVPFVAAVPFEKQALRAQRVEPDAVRGVSDAAAGGVVVAVVGSADGSATVHGLSGRSGRAALSRSEDQGRTWVPVLSLDQAVAVPDGLPVVLAAAGGADLVAAAAGPKGQIMVSHDGGKTLDLAASQPVVAAGWRWVAAAGGGTYYAVPADAEAGFYRSADHGRTWAAVRIR